MLKQVVWSSGSQVGKQGFLEVINTQFIYLGNKIPGPNLIGPVPLSRGTSIVDV